MAAIELKQQLKLTQQLIMTPQLQQAIKLLQLSRLELLDTIHQELETNPVLEENLEEHGETVESDQPAATDADPVNPFPEVEVSEKMREDFDWESYLDEYSSGTPVLMESESNREFPSYDHRLSVPDSLQEHLMWQLRLSSIPEDEREIGGIIIGNLNGDGYLDATLEEIAAMGETEVRVVESVLAKMQMFDPVGVGARDLRECLLVQAKMLNHPNDLVIRIVENYLHFLEPRTIPRWFAH